MILILLETLKAQRVALLLLSLVLFGFAVLITATLGPFEADPDTPFHFPPDALQPVLNTQAVAGAHPAVMARLDPLLDAWIWDVEPQDIWPMGAQRRTAAAERARP